MIKPLIRKNRNDIQCPVVREFHQKGYLTLKGILSSDVLSNIKYTFDFTKWLKNRGMIFESDGVTARSLFGIHKLRPKLIKELIKSDLLSLCKKLLNNDCYIYQSHINYKKRYEGGGVLVAF